MQIEGLQFIFAELNKMAAGHCAACETPLVSGRSRQFTCDDVCHHVWIERLVKVYGETKRLTLASTGKTYLVPTRVILEQGIRAEDLTQYPEAR